MARGPPAPTARSAPPARPPRATVLVILDRVPVGPDLCVPHSLKVRDEQLWATFETSFKGRTVAAMIGLYRVGRRVAEAAEAADER